MGDYKKYLKDKFQIQQKGIVGKATLSPPKVTEALTSAASMTILDLLAEGPIEGLITKSNKYAKGLKVFESLYLDGTPVKEPQDFTPVGKYLPFTAIQNVDRLTTGSIDTMINNITGFVAADVTNRSGGFYYNDGLFFERRGTSTNSASSRIRQSSNAMDYSKFATLDFHTTGSALIVQTEISDRNGVQPTFNDNDDIRYAGVFKASGNGTHRFEISVDDLAAVWFNREPYQGSTESESNDNSNVKSNHNTEDSQGSFISGFNVDLESGRLYPIIIIGSDGGGAEDLKMRFYCPDENGNVNLGAVRGEDNDKDGLGFFFHAKHDLPALSAGSRNFTAGSTQNVNNPTGIPAGVVQSSSKYEGIPDGASVSVDSFGRTYASSQVHTPTGIAKVTLDDAKAFRQQTLDFIGQNSGLARFGAAQYKINGLFSTSDNISGRMSAYQSGITSGDAAGVPHLMTSFNFDVPLQHNVTSAVSKETPMKRQIKTETNDVISIPEEFNFITPQFTNNSANLQKDGRVENLRQISGFRGGGIFFFEVGTGNSTNAGTTNFDTAKHFVPIADSDFDIKIQSGRDFKYDVFSYSSTGICLESASPLQVSPPIGETNGGILKTSFISDLNSVFNYNNVAFSFRDGYEQQPKLDGYDQGVLDFEVRKKLFGPLILRHGANSGIGTGFSDVRTGLAGGDFSSWMVNSPLEHDAYSHKHIIKRVEVDQAYPTVVVNALFDKISRGDDAGVMKEATIEFGIDVGFEGDVPESGGLTNTNADAEMTSLLADGNSLKSIALRQFRKTYQKRLTSIIQSTYMKTFSDLDDLPKNSDLKNLKINHVDIPGLSKSHVSTYGFQSGAYLFPGNTWREVNRYIKVQKNSAETQSVLVVRDCALNYITEVVKENFVYPYSAIGGTTFDARTFSSQPRREFDVRLKKILIPSNYQPLNEDGSDKRFVDASSEYGKRNIYKFNASSHGKVENSDINLGTDNFEIEVKVKFGSIITDESAYQYVIDTDGGTTTANRIAVFQRDNKIQIFGRQTDASSIGGANVDISSYSANDIFHISVKRIGAVITFTVKVGDTTVGSQTLSSISLNLNYDISAGRDFLIGINGSEGTSTRLTNNSQLADLKIYKNNQLLHWWDGTETYTEKREYCFKDKFGGNHATIVGTINTLNGINEFTEDTNFEFGKNKSVLYNGEWDGTFKLGWSDNPAWVLYDLMINPMYGLGNQIDDKEDINIFKLYELGRHCDAVDSDGLFDGVPDSTAGLEPRFSANFRLFNPKNAFETLGNVASIFRAVQFWNGSAINYTVDKKKEIAAIFNNSNVEDGVFNYGDTLASARYTRVEVPFADAKDEFTIKFEYVEDEEQIRKHGVVTNRSNGIGCTSRSQARRLGKYIMLSNKMETEIIGFKAGLEAMFLEPGDIIRVDDELMNFEINHGRILGIDTTSHSPGFLVENVINTGSIMLGNGGGVYTYNNKKQTELHELRDIAKFEQQNIFGLNNDIYNGTIPIQQIEDQDIEQISKFYVTGFEAERNLTNTIKVLVDEEQDSYSDITGVPTGAYFNVQLNNNVSKEYKIVKITPEQRGNVFEIQALEYDRRKFDMVEADDFDFVDTPHNIGIPKHTVNRPSAPTFTFAVEEAPNLTHVVKGTITAAAGSNETSYRVTALRKTQSSPYIQKEVSRESDGTTDYRLDNLIDGSYIIRVNALRNPESSSSAYHKFTISPPKQIYSKSLFKTIGFRPEQPDLKENYERQSSTGYGTGNFVGTDCEYIFHTVDEFNRDLNIQKFDYTIDVYAKTGENYTLIKENHNSNRYEFTEVQNRLMYGSVNTGFQLKFNLKQGSQVIDTAFVESKLT